MIAEEFNIQSKEYLASEISALGTAARYDTMAKYVIENNLDVDSIETCVLEYCTDSLSRKVAKQIMQSLQPSSKKKRRKR